MQVLHGMKTDDPSYVLRIDKNTGKTVWKVERPTDAVGNRPTLTRRPPLLVTARARRSSSAAAMWSPVTIRQPAKNCGACKGLNPSQPRRLPHRRVTGRRRRPDHRAVPAESVSSPSVRADAATSRSRTRSWQFSRGPDVPTPVSDGTHVFIVTDNGVVYALDAKTGAPVWGPNRLKSGTYSASPVLADGRVYATNEDGMTSVFKAGATFELLAENPSERLHAQLARGLAGTDLHPHRQTSVCDWRANGFRPSRCGRKYSTIAAPTAVTRKPT